MESCSKPTDPFCLLCSLTIWLHLCQSAADKMSAYNFTLDPKLFHKHTQTPFVGWIKVDTRMEDVVRHSDQHVTLTCEITGNPTPTYIWSKHNLTLYDDRDRLSIKNVNWGSRLKIKSVTVADGGLYTCQGVNNFGRVNTSAQLLIKEGTLPTKITTPKPHHRKAPPKSIKPPPKRKPPVKQPPTKTENSSAKGSLSDHLGRVAGEKRDQTQQLGVNNVPNSLPEIHYPGTGTAGHGEGMCQPYRGSACARFIHNTSVYVQSVYEQGLKEEKLTVAFMLMATTYSLSDKCKDVAIPTVCTHVFSPCSDDVNSGPRRICADDCHRLETGICRKDFVKARDNHLLGEVIPDCSLLRLHNPDCIRIGVFLEPSNTHHTCYNGTGVAYRGQHSSTTTGVMCLRWDGVRKKGTTVFNLRNFPELGENYCRNPGDEEDGPWCFIKDGDGKIIRKTCDVPQCESSSVSTVKNMVYIIVPGITVPVMVILLMLAFCIYRRCLDRKDRKMRAKANPKSPQKPLHKPVVVTKPLERVGSIAATTVVPKVLPISSVRFLQELGEGQFGKVYKGEITESQKGDATGVGETRTVPVAIKTLKDKSQLHLQSIFVRESEVMASLKHANIVCLIGVCMAEDPVCMVFEYMTLGDLHNILITHSPHSDVVADDASSGLPRILCFEHMMSMSKQVACGMDYLANRGFIHGDLAARNILVGDKLSIKISDFGLSRDMNSSDYYQVHTKSLLPVRWMPPEAILYGTFSRESDIWSYGVVLWEIFSYGLQPYYGYSNPEVVQVIRSRKLLSCPQHCPAEMYAVMLDCWNENSRERPTFRNILDQYNKWQSKFASLTSTAAWVKLVQVHDVKPQNCSPLTVDTGKVTAVVTSNTSPRSVSSSNDVEVATINAAKSPCRTSLSGQMIPALSMDIVRPPYLQKHKNKPVVRKPNKGSATESVSSHQSTGSRAGSLHAVSPTGDGIVGTSHTGSDIGQGREEIGHISHDECHVYQELIDTQPRDSKSQLGRGHEAHVPHPIVQTRSNVSQEFHGIRHNPNHVEHNIHTYKHPGNIDLAKVAQNMSHIKKVEADHHQPETPQNPADQMLPPVRILAKYDNPRQMTPTS